MNIWCSNFRTKRFVFINLPKKLKNSKWIDLERFQRRVISIKEWTKDLALVANSINHTVWFIRYRKNSSIKVVCVIIVLICLVAFIPYYQLVRKRFFKKTSKYFDTDIDDFHDYTKDRFQDRRYDILETGNPMPWRKLSITDRLQSSDLTFERIHISIGVMAENIFTLLIMLQRV